MTYEDNDYDISEDSRSEDSGVVNSLRKQLRHRDKEIADLKASIPSRDTIEADIRKDWDIEHHLEGLGHPKTIRQLVREQMGDTAVSVESVTSALEAIGYKPMSAPPDPSPQVANPALQQVSALSAKVASASGGVTDMTSRIMNAQTPQEIEELARAGGFLVQ